MGSTPGTDTVLSVFAAVEQRDSAALARVCLPDAEFHWPPSLPYGGSVRGSGAGRRGWAAHWDWLQPTAAERRLDPQVIAARGPDVVVLWRQRGRSPAGDRLDSEVLGLYTVRDGRLARAQMFYFDTAAVCAFLASASPMPRQRPDHSRTTA